MKKLLLLLMLTLLPSCAPWNAHSTIEADSSASPLIDLVDSTHIIRMLISQNKISGLLEEHDSEQLDLLLDNKSPAQMAFEAEVLSSISPLVAVYYFQKHKDRDECIEQLEALAMQYEDQIKFVLVDVERLFSLAQDAQIEEVPTLVLVKDREIIDQLNGDLSSDALKAWLSKYSA